MNTGHKILVIVMITLLTLLPAGFASAGDDLVLPDKIDLTGSTMNFDSSQFQASINSDESLGSLALQNTSIDEGAVEFGFAAKSEEAKFFIIGTLFSESLAYLRGGNNQMAVNRLKAMEREFIEIGVTPSLYNYITKLRNMVETERYEGKVITEIFSLFQPFFEDFAKGRNDDNRLLFQTGSWLVDMSLAAASGNKGLLVQTEKLKFLSEEMKRMDAPKGVIDALADITNISAKKEIEDRDTKKVLKLVKKMQSLLG